MKYREATVLDAAGITKIKVDTWKTAYKGIIVDDYLQSLSYEDNEKNWRQRLENPTHGAKIFVAETNQNEIVGFTFVTLEKGNPILALLQAERFKGELCAIYVLNEFQYKKIGTELVELGVNYLKVKNIDSMITWVLKQNPSRIFYEKLGGRVLGEQSIEIGGIRYTEIAYGWEDIKKILSHF